MPPATRRSGPSADKRLAGLATIAPEYSGLGRSGTSDFSRKPHRQLVVEGSPACLARCPLGLSLSGVGSKVSPGTLGFLSLLGSGIASGFDPPSDVWACAAVSGRRPGGRGLFAQLGEVGQDLFGMLGRRHVRVGLDHLAVRSNQVGDAFRYRHHRTSGTYLLGERVVGVRQQ
jgi:hypothetical protein